TAAELAIENEYDYVICGHIHEPKMIRKVNKNGTTFYLNSGDWVENLTALEYNKKRWKLYRYDKDSQMVQEDLFEFETKLSEQLVASLIFSSAIGKNK
ncbi:MAG: UDP-2,3-diacylglucosamine diphosphatase, partial [Flavobacterium sp.]